MNEAAGTLEQIILPLACFLGDFGSEFTEEKIIQLFDELGLHFPETLKDQTDFMNALNNTSNLASQLPTLIERLSSAIQQENYAEIPTRSTNLITGIVNFVESFDTLTAALSNLVAALDIDPDELSEFVQNLPKRLLEYSVITTLEKTSPLSVTILEALGVILRSEENKDSTDPLKPPYTKRSLELANISPLLENSFEYFQGFYGWGEASFNGVKLLETLEKLLASIGFPVFLDKSVIPHRLDLIGVEVLPDTSVTPPGMAMQLTDDITQQTITWDRDNWIVQMGWDIQVGPGTRIIYQPNNRLTFSDTPGPVGGKIFIEWASKGTPAHEPVLLFGKPGGTRLEAEEIRARAEVDLEWDSAANKAEGEFKLEAEIKKGKVILDASEGDGFLGSVLPAKTEAQFDVAMGVSTETGFYFRGSSALEIKLPIHIGVGGVEMQSLILGIGASEDGIPINLGASFKAELGPLIATVDNIGLTATFSFPEDNSGNLGPLDIEPRFKWPTGVGLSIDGGGFKGGGFLQFDYENERYSGVLELQFKDMVNLKAIGLITTRLPGGESGFSLLIIISAEFQPVQLGFGFTLNGVGGLLGLNRTVMIDVLREGVKTNSLASVLFPQDIVANAPRIISDLRQIFPPTEGRFVFGPMAKICWGTPAILTIDLGLIIEVPHPVKVAILGVLRAILPDDKLKLIKIQVNFLGAWEEDKQMISFDASLFDSKLVTYPLVGDMAFRLGYGDNPNFLVTVGGFHPSFTPPPLALPVLQRVMINLISGNNPKLTLSAYFAVTSNTVQLGARIELYAKAWKFNVYGFLAFDALFQFSPFYFIVSISGGVAVRSGSSVLFSIGLELTVEGPTPWNAKGTASFKILFVKVKVKFEKTWGQNKNTVLPDVDIFPMLEDALKNKGNWQATLPSRNNLLVTIREITDLNSTDIVAHPAGILTVKQKIVPLDTTIARFGSQKPSGASRFSIDRVYSDDIEFNKVNVEEHFAPAQFFEMNDAEKLSRKSFERLPAGVKVTSSDNDIQSSKVVSRKVEYETIIVDTRTRILRFVKFIGEHLGTFIALLRGNSAAKSRFSYVNNAEPVLGPGKVNVTQEGFTVVGTDNLAPFDASSSFGSETGAYGYMQELVGANPSLVGQIQVVPAYEVSEVA